MLGSFVLPLWLLGLSLPPFEWLARLMLARGPNGLTELGIFTAAFAWGQVVLIAPAPTTRSAMPILTTCLASADAAGFRRALRDALVTAVALAMLAALPIVGLSPWIMRAYGIAFGDAAIIVAIVAVSSIVAAISGVLRTALLAAGRAWTQTLHTLTGGAVLIALFALTRGHGAFALACSYLAAFTVVLIAQTCSAVWGIAALGPAASAARG
jgi:O-antigen/teichoic acid export membrane protein